MAVSRHKIKNEFPASEVGDPELLFDKRPELEAESNRGDAPDTGYGSGKQTISDYSNNTDEEKRDIKAIEQSLLEESNQHAPDTQYYESRAVLSSDENKDALGTTADQFENNSGKQDLEATEQSLTDEKRLIVQPADDCCSSDFARNDSAGDLRSLIEKAGSLAENISSDSDGVSAAIKTKSCINSISINIITRSIDGSDGETEVQDKSFILSLGVNNFTDDGVAEEGNKSLIKSLNANNTPTDGFGDTKVQDKSSIQSLNIINNVGDRSISLNQWFRWFWMMIMQLAFGFKTKLKEYRNILRSTGRKCLANNINQFTLISNGAILEENNHDDHDREGDHGNDGEDDDGNDGEDDDDEGDETGCTVELHLPSYTNEDYRGPEPIVDDIRFGIQETINNGRDITFAQDRGRETRLIEERTHYSVEESHHCDTDVSELCLP